VVSDAASTGTTLRGVVASVRGRGAREIIVALPVGPAGVITDLGERADRVVHLATPAHLIARQSHYPQPREVDDDEIARLVRAANGPATPAPKRPGDRPRPSDGDEPASPGATMTKTTLARYARIVNAQK
jgi:predicted phosphoribosyltransferase